MSTVPFLKFYDPTFKEVNFWEICLDKMVTNPSPERVYNKKIYDLLLKSTILQEPGNPTYNLIIKVKLTDHQGVKNILSAYAALDDLNIISGIINVLIDGQHHPYEKYGTLWWLTFMTSGKESDREIVLKNVNPIIKKKKLCSISDFMDAVQDVEEFFLKCRGIYNLFHDYIKFFDNTLCGKNNLDDFKNGITERNFIEARLSDKFITKFVFSPTALGLGFQKHLIGLKNTLDFTSKKYPDLYLETKQRYDQKTIKPQKGWLRVKH